MNSSALVRSPESRVREEHQPDFADGVCDLESRSLHYKLFVPERTGGAPAPLLLMLHGCGQDAQDFSAGTQMNAIAQEAGMYVLYPSQSRSANANNCWNWFVPEHQTRDGGEPAALSTLTRFIMESHPVDPQQVFVAGLSAGGAMALILAEQYPELYSAVGVHSGLPSGAASSMMEAFRLMSQSATGASLPDGLSNAVTDMSPRRKVSANSRSSTGNATTAGIHTPLIVFHGDNDRTVNCANAERIVGNWLERETARLGDVNWQTTSMIHATASGRRSVVTTYSAESVPERAACEYWRLIDGGHSWSGGSAAGSYTDTAGPNASVEMVRFFLDRIAA
ncbi:extracellular catalytic domain type 1 short-chain-length polyhydroxyalkanoate depolymerase [Granulosicoccus sp. 3-233]|uniref:extracellular catalytic domain type 1 short-chain-length polyhydroxyalkanoate depolymerase n=1 Tax=Granulosicoccus sp. 3-233 TaxID=3417969 RepID=UPI003D3349A0